MDRHERGHAAERLARDLLVEHGLVALDANWRRRVGEIDLIMREPSDGTIVFVEVRFRARECSGGALESVDAGKRARLRRAALAWLQRHGDLDSPARIDVVAIGPAAERGRPAPGPGGTRDRGEARGGAIGDDALRNAPGGGKANAVERPDRLLARRGGHPIEWIVGAIEEED